MANSASDLTPKIAQAVDLTFAESIWLWLQANIMQIIGAIAVLVIGLLVASFLCEKILLPRFDNTKEVVEDQNLGTAFVEAGVHIANGLIVLATQQGEGSLWTGLAFWALAIIAYKGAVTIGECKLMQESLVPPQVRPLVCN